MVGWKKCPFCGCETVIVDDRKGFEARVREHGQACMAASCGNRACGCALYVYSSTEFPNRKFKYADMVERLRAKWNRRTPA